MLAAHDWYAIGASFRGKKMGVRRPDATMTPLDVAVMKHAFSQPGVATGGINFYRANFFRFVASMCNLTCIALLLDCLPTTTNPPRLPTNHPPGPRPRASGTRSARV